MSNVSQWETSAPNNDAAPPNGAPEGMAANTVNDTMREMMAAVARWYQDINGSLVTGGAGNAYTLSTNNNNSSLTDLPLVVFVANRANTGASTLNVDGLGAKSLRFNGAALISGHIAADTAYLAVYNADDDVFDLVGIVSKDASAITTGELPDARLSSNIPRLNSQNIFTAQVLIHTSSQLPFSLLNSSAPEGARRYRFAINNAGSFSIRASDDAGSTVSQPISIERSQSTGVVTEVDVTAPILDFNGDADISGTLAVDGEATFKATGNANTNASAVHLISTLPAIRFTDSNAPENAKDLWVYHSSGAFNIAIADEDGANLESGIRVVSSGGGVIAEVELNATTLDFNGDVDISGSLTVGGAVRAGTAATSTSSTLAAGQIHHRSSNTTVPSMSAGQWVAVQNTGTSSITLSEGSGVTLELAGTTTTGNRTLAAKGFAFIYFRANNVGVCGGAGVS